ncbi:unnamed protein product [Closterium sp. Naga37s-1]|nr:unnamed protein product [Closterium sp. Naga37s-1]
MASSDVLLAGFMDGLASKGGAILDRLQAHAARLLPVHHLASPSPSPSLSPLARSPLPLASLSLPLSPPPHDDSPAPPSPQQWRPPHLRGMPHRRRGGGPPGSTPPARSVDSRGTAPGGAGGGGGGGGGKAEEERVLISEIVIRDKDGGEVEDEELLKVVAGALKVSKANAALTTREVQEDVHRIIDTGEGGSMWDGGGREGGSMWDGGGREGGSMWEGGGREGGSMWEGGGREGGSMWEGGGREGGSMWDGGGREGGSMWEGGGREGGWEAWIRVALADSRRNRGVEANQEMKGLMCVGANVLPTRVIEDAFRDEYGKVVNIQRLNGVLDVLNGWYSDRGLFGQVTDVELLSDGVVRVKVAEAEVNNITIKFRDRKTGEPTTGKTRPETILRQLMTKKGQVYSLQQGRRDVETVFTMGIMEDVNLIPHPAPGDTGMVDLTMNVVERPPGGFSAGGGLSGSSLSGGALSGLIGSFTYSHRNVRGRNQKLNVAVERGQLDSIFRASYSDPWIEGDDKRTSRAINIQNSRTPDMMVHGVRRDGSAGGPWAGGVTIARVVASVDYSRPIRPRWTATAGLNLQRAGARDDHGHPKLVDAYGSPLTFSGRASDDMLIAKLETVYTDSGDNASSQLVLSTEQAIPIAPDWLFFNRINARARNGFRIGHARLIGSFSGGTVVGDLAPHEAFPIGGTNSVRGYDEGAVGSGRSYIVTSGEISFPMFGPLEGAFFADYGTDLGSGATVLGDPAGARGKPGRGFGLGAGVRVDSPLGPLRLEYAFNDQKIPRFHFGIGYRN